MMHPTLRFTAAPGRTVVVSHVRELPVTLQLTVHEFIPSNTEQLQYWYRDHGSGWGSHPTANYAMKKGLGTDTLEKYIQDHTYHLVHTSFVNSPILSEIFRIALSYSQSPDQFLLRDTLQLWTASQLLIRSAALHPSSDTLGISPILTPMVDHSYTPPPRVLADQLDHLLERRIWQLEKQILAELQKRIFARKRHDWLKIFLTTTVLLNALERDSWRLYDWIINASPDGNPLWRHPLAPQQLLDKNDMLAESLAAHFVAISKGLCPFTVDWARDQTVGLMNPGGTLAREEIDAVVDAVERVGRGLRSREHAAWIVSVTARYTPDDEASLDFLYSSKVMAT